VATTFGQITELAETTSDSGKTYTRLILGEMLFCVWNKALIKDFKVGDMATAEYKEGEFPKLIKLAKGGQAAPVPMPAETLAIVNKEHNIAKAVALKAAIEAFGELKGGDNVSAYAPAVLDLAQVFLNWLRDDTV
jgi:hypothetical protein